MPWRCDRQNTVILRRIWLILSPTLLSLRSRSIVHGSSRSILNENIIAESCSHIHYSSASFTYYVAVAPYILV
ncbi:hypothetical protein BJX70DRAFT_379771 [Aspergillus crustosus]